MTSHDAVHAGNVDLSALARQAMIDRGLEPDFPPTAFEQVKHIAAPAVDASLRDLRSLLWCSIDNDDSKDLDQLSVAEPQPGGAMRILVAVADVDALVPLRTPIDEHARRNTTSVYTPTRVFSMLPERLSTDLTSLNPDGDRIAMVIAYTVRADGGVEQGSVERATVRNHAKLTYRAVGAWLESHGPVPPAVAAVPGLADQLRMQDDAAQKLRQRRHEDGALDLETIEARAIVVDGKTVDIRRENKNRAQALIEDFMIAANGVSARFLEAKGFPSIRRVVRVPKRWDRLQALAAETGTQLPATPDAKALNAFLCARRAADPERFPDLSLSVVKLMGRGEYVLTRSHEEGMGHFGLAATDYVHTTAPNRRFPDLVTHRLLKAALAGGVLPYPANELDAIATHCTAQEDAADKVERQLRKSAAALVLSARVGHTFDAIVTGASNKGTYVRVVEPPAEGRVMGDVAGIDVGDRLKVRLIGTDVTRGFIDFERLRS